MKELGWPLNLGRYFQVPGDHHFGIWAIWEVFSLFKSLFSKEKVNSVNFGQILFGDEPS
jgi:hypothetical protein